MKKFSSIRSHWYKFGLFVIFSFLNFAALHKTISSGLVMRSLLETLAKTNLNPLHAGPGAVFSSDIAPYATWGLLLLCIIFLGVSIRLHAQKKTIQQRTELLHQNLVECKSHEKELLEKEANYRELVEHAATAILRIDTEGRILFINEYAQAAFAHSPKTTTNSNCIGTIFSEGCGCSHLAKNHIEKIRNGGAPFCSFECLHSPAHSTPLWMSWTSRALIDPDGHISGILYIGVDITERKKVETALRESEARYRALFENAPIGIFQSTVSGKLLNINPAFAVIFGYDSPEEIISSIADTSTLYAEPKQRGALIARIIENNESIDEEISYLRKDGSIFVGSLHLQMTRNLDGTPRYVEGFIRDITQRQKAEAALRESELRYRTLFESAPLGIGLGRLDGSVMDCNEALLFILGYDRSEIGQINLRYTCEDAEECNFIFMRQMMEGKLVRNTEVKLKRKDGTPFDANLTVNRFSIGGQDAILTLAEDITNQKLLESRLQQAQKMEAIGTLAGGIAHDFNNLLMGILGNISLLLMDLTPSDPSYEILKHMEKYVKNGSDLTKQLLGFARGGKYEVNPTNINALLTESCNMFGRTRKEIAIHTKLPENIWTVNVDRLQIEQVFLNIFVNAWQAMPSGGSLYIRTENIRLDSETVSPIDLAPGPYVKISITDTGTGMDPNTLKRIFDPFFTTREMGVSRGAGLGMASAYGIVKNHGGIINVYSEKGHGSTFSIYLPAVEKKIAVTAPPPEEAQGVQKGERTILLVDDESMILNVASQMLRHLRYKVLAVNNGKEAVDAYQKNQDSIALVILDMIMPSMSGGDVFDQLKQINPDVRVLLSSGYSINGQASEIIKRGCNGFIQKPFNLEQLSQKIRKILAEC